MRMPAFLTVWKYEFQRYIFSNRFFLLMIASIFPTVLFLDYAAEMGSVNIALFDETSFFYLILSAYMLSTFVINVLVSIVVVWDLFTTENAMSFLSVATSRISVFTGKLLACWTILLISSIASLLGLTAVLFAWNIPLPPIGLTGMSVGWLFLASLIPLSITIFASNLAIKYKSLPPSTTAYLPLFLFFLLPFAVYASLVEFGYFSDSMLDLSPLTYIKQLLFGAVYDPKRPPIEALQRQSFYQTIIGTFISIFVLTALSGNLFVRAED